VAVILVGDVADDGDDPRLVLRDGPDAIRRGVERSGVTTVHHERPACAG